MAELVQEDEGGWRLGGAVCSLLVLGDGGNESLP